MSLYLIVPRSIETDGVNLFVADGSNRVIRKIDLTTNKVSTIAGQVGVSGNTDGNRYKRNN